MIGYEIESRGLDEQIDKLDQFNPIVQGHMVSAMTSSVRRVGGQARINAPRGRTNRLAGSVGENVLVEADAHVIGRVEAKEFYGLWSEFGTAAHGVSSDTIEQKMGVDPNAGYFIARSIARKGTRGRKWMYKAFKQTEGAVRGFFARALVRITKDLSV